MTQWIFSGLACPKNSHNVKMGKSKHTIKISITMKSIDTFTHHRGLMKTTLFISALSLFFSMSSFATDYLCEGYCLNFKDEDGVTTIINVEKIYAEGTSRLTTMESLRRECQRKGYMSTIGSYTTTVIKFTGSSFFSDLTVHYPDRIQSWEPLDPRKNCSKE